MESVAKKYRSQAVFLFVYCREAHPEGDQKGRSTRTKQNQPIPQARSVDDRKAMARQFCDDMKMSRRIAIDDFGDKSVQRQYGGFNNPTVVVDVDGKIALKMAWTNGHVLDEFLARFIANGSKLDKQLAASVPLQGPRGGRRNQSDTPGMVARMLEGAILTATETKAVQSALQRKMEMRGRLRQKAQELDGLARRPDVSNDAVERAIQEFETDVAEFQKAAVKLDRGLTSKLSAKARAQLLAIGVLENGIGMQGPGMRAGVGPGSPRPGPNQQPDGPWNHQIHIATSEDGVRWNIVREPIMRLASGPDIIELTGKGKAGAKGSMCIYTLDARSSRAQERGEGIALLRSTDDGKSWSEPHSISIDGLPERGGVVDPSIVQLEDGKLRLYFYLMKPRQAPPGDGAMHRFYSAISDDGVRFRLEQGVRFESPDITDPEVVRVGDEWLMFISHGQEVLLARSTDGLRFQRDPKFRLGGGGVPGALPLENGKVRVYQSGRGITSVFFDPRSGEIE